ncbi:MAG: DUF202 domain-containing protein [Sediminibacterium sp.]|nr:DUF202 domain-containing protein [Sediminibacterium sp.]
MQVNEQEQDTKTLLAIERTLYAVERTQLAWVRTTLAMLGSGIALDKGMEYIHQTRVIAGTALFESAHILGVVLSFFSTILLLLSTAFSYRRLSVLTMQMKMPSISRLPSLFLSLLVVLLGATISILLWKS